MRIPSITIIQTVHRPGPLWLNQHIIMASVSIVTRTTMDAFVGSNGNEHPFGSAWKCPVRRQWIYVCHKWFLPIVGCLYAAW